MNNLTPSSLTTLHGVLHRIADYERELLLRRKVIADQVDTAILVGRIQTAQPSMAWVDGPRAQPRDGRGRFLPRTWLADAELFLPADLKWFRSPITEGK